MIEVLRRVLDSDPRIAYAVLFGSTARHTAHAHSDIDIAIGTSREPLDPLAFGDVAARLETATGRAVHLVLLNDAPPGLAYRVFRDGIPLMVRDERSFRTRLARAVLEYLDFKPVEDLFVQAVLRPGRG